jgi:hypothetical protein
MLHFSDIVETDLVVVDVGFKTKVLLLVRETQIDDKYKLFLVLVLLPVVGDNSTAYFIKLNLFEG